MSSEAPDSSKEQGGLNDILSQISDKASTAFIASILVTLCIIVVAAGHLAVIVLATIRGKKAKKEVPSSIVIQPSTTEKKSKRRPRSRTVSEEEESDEDRVVVTYPSKNITFELNLGPEATGVIIGQKKKKEDELLRAKPDLVRPPLPPYAATVEQPKSESGTRVTLSGVSMGSLPSTAVSGDSNAGAQKSSEVRVEVTTEQPKTNEADIGKDNKPPQEPPKKPQEGQEEKVASPKTPPSAYEQKPENSEKEPKP